MTSPTMFVSFSGGRTSGYMCRWLLDNKADEYDLKFCFANTGCEHEKTLEFVDRCDREWGLNLAWLEAVVNPEHGKGIRHKQVTFETASRNGEPFEAHIAKSGIPNQDYNQCSERLKEFVMNDYRRSLGFKPYHSTCIGIRSDEVDRVSARATEYGLVYPLVQWTQVTKEEVRHWWSGQDFDLDLPEHHGNCVWCWKKSPRKLLTIAKNNPEFLEFPASMERLYSNVKAPAGPRTFFRGNKTTADLLEESKEPFREFADHMPELQLGMFDPMDLEADCGGGCEIQGSYDPGVDIDAAEYTIDQNR